MVAKLPRHLGAVFTPPDYAQLPVNWAIQNKEFKVLDLGVGEGVFTFAAAQRLVELGASTAEAQQQIYGAEIYSPTYETFLVESAKRDLDFRHVINDDFFKVDFPEVDAAVGNSPWVRRSDLDNVDEVRQETLDRLLSIDEQEVSRLTDLYVYYLLKASTHLKPGGKLAVITADSWLNARYGVALKEFLQRHFILENLISFDRLIFDAQVRSVFILATKKEAEAVNNTVSFIRVKNGLPASDLIKSVNNPEHKQTDVEVRPVKSQELLAEHPWGLYFKATDICEYVSHHEAFTPLSDIAATRIGIQTLAKDFFVFTAEEAESSGITKWYLKPLAHSSRYVNTPVIEPGSAPAHYLFYCAKSKADIADQKALEYIQEGERKVVPVRGKNVTVVGYHNKERIIEAGRENWYDLASELRRRGRWEILIPRLIYRSYAVVWNKAKFIPGELFIECRPNEATGIETEVMLAILTSSLTEVVIRSYAQLYGGGTTNLSPGQIKNLPVLDATKLTDVQKKSLTEAYRRYSSDPQHDRSAIDNAIYKIIDFDLPMQGKVTLALDDLRTLAASPKKNDLNI